MIITSGDARLVADYTLISVIIHTSAWCGTNRVVNDAEPLKIREIMESSHTEGPANIFLVISGVFVMIPIDGD
jgi:hypothetical protein